MASFDLALLSAIHANTAIILLGMIALYVTLTRPEPTRQRQRVLAGVRKHNQPTARSSGEDRHEL